MTLTRLGAGVARRLAAPAAAPAASFAMEVSPKYVDRFLLYPAPTRYFSSTPAATGVTGAAAGSTGSRAAAAATARSSAMRASTKSVDGFPLYPAPKRYFSSTGATTGVTGAAAGATGAAPPSESAAGILLKPFGKITLEDMIQEWGKHASIRRMLYFAASGLFTAFAGTGYFAYVLMEDRIENKVISALDQIKKGLINDLKRENAEREAAETREADKREAAEMKEKQRREDWELRLQVLVNDILSKFVKLEEKEWNNRQKVLQAEEILKKFGFSNDAETYYEVAKQFKMLQFQVDSLKAEISEEKGATVADKALETIVAIDSQVTALRKMILEAGIVREADLDWTGKGVVSNEKVKK